MVATAEQELSPITKGFVGKGPRSRPSSARPQSSSASGDQQQQQQQLPVDLEAGPEGSTGGHNNASGGHSHHSGGSGAVSSGGSGGGRGAADLSARPGGGRLSGGGDSSGQLRRRSRSASLSRDLGEQANKQVNSGRAEPEAQHAPSTAEGEQLFGRDAADKHRLYGVCVELIQVRFSLGSVPLFLSDLMKSPCLPADADRPMFHHMFALSIFQKNIDTCNVGVGSTGNNETATASKRGNKRGHSALKQDSDSDRDGSDNYVPGSESAAAAAAAAKAKK